MGKKSKKHRARQAAEATPALIGFTSTMPITGASLPGTSSITPAAIVDPLSAASQPLGSLPPIQVAGARPSDAPPFSVTPLAAVPTTASTAPAPQARAAVGTFPATASAPSSEQVLAQEAQRRLVELAVEKETLSVRLEDAARQRGELETRVAELGSIVEGLQGDRSGSQAQLAAAIAERDKLHQENRDLQDEILRLPAELEAVSKSRAFRIMKAAPILAIRKPLSTLLIVGAMGALANLWDFSNLARSIYLAVGSVVLLVSAIQFLSRND